MTRALAPVLTAVMVLASVPSTARAQNRWREEVVVQVDHAAKVLKDHGYTRTDLYDGALNHDASESLTLPLRAGREYALIAVCDVDCDNLDLRLYGGNDQEMASDVEKDDVPVIMFAPQRDGKYRLKITMTKCGSSPCHYGVGLFVK